MIEKEIEGNYLAYFRFEGNKYHTNMTIDELYGSNPFSSMPIKLPDGRFVEITCWRTSDPPQIGEVETIENCSGSKYAIAELVP